MTAPTLTLCRVCRGVMTGPLEGFDTHPGCDDGKPHSLLLEIRDALMLHEMTRPRSMQRELGPSELGTPCQRQIAYKLAGVAPMDASEPAWAPWQGTNVHTGMEELLTWWNDNLSASLVAEYGPRWVIEDDLIIDDEGEIPGHGDAYDAWRQEVVDWKYVGATALGKLQRAQRAGKPLREHVTQDYRVQAHLYGKGHARKGRTVKAVRLVLLARSWKFDDSAEWVEPYDERIADWAIERYRTIRNTVAPLALSETVTEDVAKYVAPAPGEACGFCSFAHICPSATRRSY
jgi:hypothetical protein